MNKPAPEAMRAPTDWKTEAMQKRIRRRYARERRFKLFGMMAVILSAAFLAFLLFTMVTNGWRGFTRTEIALPLDFPAMALKVDPAQLSTPGANLALASAELEDKVSNAALAAYGPQTMPVLSDAAWLKVREALKGDPSLLGRRTTLWVPASTQIE